MGVSVGLCGSVGSVQVCGVRCGFVRVSVGRLGVCASFVWFVLGLCMGLCGFLWGLCWFVGIFVGLRGFACRLRADGVEGVSEGTAVPVFPAPAFFSKAGFPGSSTTVIGEPDLAAQAEKVGGSGCHGNASLPPRPLPTSRLPRTLASGLCDGGGSHGRAVFFANCAQR